MKKKLILTLIPVASLVFISLAIYAVAGIFRPPVPTTDFPEFCTTEDALSIITLSDEYIEAFVAELTALADQISGELGEYAIVVGLTSRIMNINVLQEILRSGYFDPAMFEPAMLGNCPHCGGGLSELYDYVFSGVPCPRRPEYQHHRTYRVRLVFCGYYRCSHARSSFFLTRWHCSPVPHS